MKVKICVNGNWIKRHIAPGMMLVDFLRREGMYGVKRGCETSNCGLCTVLVEGQPTLSCSVLAARVAGKNVTTIEGLQEEALEIGGFIADQAADQCGFCSPGLIMNVISLVRDFDDPSEEEIKEYLAGNLCRCTGYVGQLRAIKAYIAHKKGADHHA